MGFFDLTPADAGGSAPRCIACLRAPADIPPMGEGSCEGLVCASFYPPAAPARGRLVICRECCVTAVTAFAHALPRPEGA